MSEVAIAAPVAAPVTSTPAVPAADLKAPAAAAVPAVDAKGEKLTPEVKAEVQKQLHKLVIDGKEEQIDTDELIRRAQKATAADRRFEEVSKAKKEVTEQQAKIRALVQMMRENPAQTAKELKDLGIDPEQLATQLLEPILREQIEAEEEKLLPPEAKKARELEKKVAEYERQEKLRAEEAKKAEEAKAQQARQAEIDRHKDDIGRTIMEALQKAKLPPTPENGLAMAQLIETALQRGLPFTPDQLAADLNARARAQFNALLKSGDVDQWLPEEVQAKIRAKAIDDPKVAEAIRKKAVAEFKKGNPLANAKATVGEPPEKKAAPKKQGSMKSAMRELMLIGAKR